MVASAEPSYPTSLQRADRRRGQLDGEQRIPALAEVRRQQQALTETGGQLAVGYQLVLLAELDEKLNELSIAHRRTHQAAAVDLSRHDERIEQARNDLGRKREQLEAAKAPLTEEELRPRNPEEARWDAEMLRHRREVARSRRIKLAQESVDDARDRVEQRHAERAAAVRQHDEASAEPGTRARRLVELYQRRIAEYLAALARYHPAGATLYPLLSMPEIPLPDWVTETAHHPPTAGARRDDAR
ncbi:hypothetical protein ACN27F_18380 [Solwaraspora sp. WMMB335]|uniref:hypothetical protein n=1 Tax=Solwaraspora sp. WMMB335 TaxID=3404118 RepID=UPI003B94912B